MTFLHRFEQGLELVSFKDSYALVNTHSFEQLSALLRGKNHSEFLMQRLIVYKPGFKNRITNEIG